MNPPEFVLEERQVPQTALPIRESIAICVDSGSPLTTDFHWNNYGRKRLQQRRCRTSLQKQVTTTLVDPRSPRSLVVMTGTMSKQLTESDEMTVVLYTSVKPRYSQGVLHLLIQYNRRFKLHPCSRDSRS